MWQTTLFRPAEDRRPRRRLAWQAVRVGSPRRPPAETAVQGLHAHGRMLLAEQQLDVERGVPQQLIFLADYALHAVAASAKADRYPMPQLRVVQAGASVLGLGGD